MKKVIKYIFNIMLVMLFVVLVVLALNANSIFAGINETRFNKDLLIQMNSKIALYDNENQFIETVSANHKIAKLSDLPDYAINAFISIEDKEFYKHDGLNYKRIAKAIYTNITNGGAIQGASTISQQLIKNTHLTSEKTLNRKIKEVLLTFKLEREFSKDDILETYLNVIYFGSSSYGIENASYNYFNKSAKELKLSEAAMLAGIIKSPRNFSPYYDIKASKTRRNLVLKEMLEDGFITNTEYQEAINEDIVLTDKKQAQVKSVYENEVIKQASKLLDLSEKDVATSGVKIYTYMNKDLQKLLQQLVMDETYYNVNEHGNTADSQVVVIDNKTGGITAFYGKSDYELYSMKRSPGSAIKPILVYAPALESGKISPITPIHDAEININGYSPHNVGDKFYGWISARESLEKSLNIPAIKIMHYNTIENSKAMAKNAGIKFDKKDTNYAIALGGFTEGVTLTELTNSYLPFSKKGKYIRANFIKKIESLEGKTLYENKNKITNVMSEETAYLMTDMLKSSAVNGTSSKLSTLDFEVAGKTGTVGIKGVNENNDAISIAYTPNVTVGAWFGNSTGKIKHRLSSSNNGGTYATMLARDVIKVANQQKNSTFTPPNTIVTKKIDALALNEQNKVYLANSNTPEMHVINAIFNKKYAPKTISPNYIKLNAPTLNVKLINKTAKIMVPVNSHIIYEVYRIEEDETTLIKTIKNKKGVAVVEDKNLEQDQIYSYYVIAKQTNYANNSTVESLESEHKKIVVNSSDNFTSIINDFKKKMKNRKRWFNF